jgi:hypothetical protein
MSQIVKMGKFTAIGMRVKVDDPKALIINTCGQNDTTERGTFTSWVWCNPTNRAAAFIYCGTDLTITAVSPECMWQGTKIFVPNGRPNPEVLNGNWRGGKAKRPIGAWNGVDEKGVPKPLITNPGEARLKIYLPAFKKLINHWLDGDSQVQQWVEAARAHSGDVYLRDHDTGRGIMRNGPMSHAWLLAEYLNNGDWPTK